MTINPIELIFHAAIDGKGRSLNFVRTGRQVHGSQAAEDVLATPCRPLAVTAVKAYGGKKGKTGHQG